MSRKNSSILHASWKKNHNNFFFIFDKKSFLYPKMMVIEKKCICPDISPSLCMIWHVNCIWFFEKSSWQSFGLNKPLFTKLSYFIKNHWSMNIFVGSSSPKYILTYGKKQRFYLAYFLKNTSQQHVFFNFWQKSYFLPQNYGIVKFVICPLISTSGWMIWHIRCGWGIYRCPQSRMMDWQTDGQTDRHYCKHFNFSLVNPSSFI